MSGRPSDVKHLSTVPVLSMATASEEQSKEKKSCVNTAKVLGSLYFLCFFRRKLLANNTSSVEPSGLTLRLER